MRPLSELLARARPPAAAHSAPADDAPPPTGDGRSATSFRERAKLRRRLRYLRQTRELAFRDLGGFVFDSNRFARPREDIVEAKLKGLEAMDRELRALEVALHERQELLVLHEPGISVCPRCGVIHGSDANFCPGCALPLGARAGLPLGPRVPTQEPSVRRDPAQQETTETRAPAE